MSLIRKPSIRSDRLETLAGLTGLGWTTSVLGYLVTLVGYGNSLVTRFVADPASLLYLGVVLLVATLGLDRLQNSLSSRDPSESSQ